MARILEPQALLALLTKFPKVRTFGADFHAKTIGICEGSGRHTAFVLQFASAVCASAVFPHLEALKLSSDSRKTFIQQDTVLEYIRSNIDRLPSSVDLSQLGTARPTNVDREFLVDLCLMLQGGRITSLALKDLVHQKAVSRLQEHFAFGKQNKITREADVGKAFAWMNESSIDERRIQSKAAWWPQAVSDFTDFRIEARKTSGPLKGSAFKVRISDWTGKQERFF